MATTTIIGYATQRRGNASQGVTEAQKQLADAQTAVSEAADRLAAETSLSVSLDKSATDIRQRLLTIPTPADGETLLAELEQVTIRQRAAQSGIVDIQADIIVAQEVATQAQADLAIASAQLLAADAALKDATAGNQRRQAWQAALEAEPLKSMKTAATDALDINKAEGANFKNAKARIEGDIPVKLRTRATDRRDAANTRIAGAGHNTKAALDAIVAEHTANGSLTDQARDLWEAFRVVESATGVYVNTAATRFDQAEKNLAAVGDKTNSPLTTEEIDRINTSDGTLETARENAADGEKAVADKRADLETKKGLLDDAVVAHLADPLDATKAQAVSDKQNDVDAAQIAFDAANQNWTADQGAYAAKILDVQAKQAALDDATRKAVAAQADPNTDPAVITARTNLNNAKQALKNAENTYKASANGTLHAWEAAVPDPTWRLFADFAQAEKALTLLSAKSAAEIEGDLTAAETAYVTAQLKADASADVLARLTAEQQTRAAREAGAQQVATGQFFSALRGDN